MKNLLAILCLFSAFFAQAQTLLTPQATGMGGQSVAMQGEAAMLGNPAGLATLENLAIAAVFERRFLLADLDLMATAATLPTLSGNFGLVVQNFGFEEFRQQKFGLAYARRLSKKLLLGGQVDYFQTRIEEYGSDGTLSFELGLQAEMSEQLVLGAHVSHPTQVEFAAGESLPTTVRMGAMFRPSGKVVLGFELEKDVDFPLRVKAGFDYLAADQLHLRAGFATDPGTFHFGLGWHLENGLRIETALRYHQTLGLTPTAGLGFVFGK